MSAALPLRQFARNDPRIRELIYWVLSILDNNITSIEFASEDASFRRYFRIFHGDRSYIVMDAPVEHMSIEPFARISRKFIEHNINVPEIFAADFQKGFMLITDFGTTTYLQILNNSTADYLYDDALETLIRIQQATASDPEFLPPYDDSLLRTEMNLLPSWYLAKHLNLSLNARWTDVLENTFEFLISKALEQPKVWVHLDYHSRNLMYVERRNPGVIDFQNAVLGPVTYDLMSLLRDVYIVWSEEQVQKWIRLYLSKADQAGLNLGCDEREFAQWFDLMGVQRHLKIAGIFSRLYYRDGKEQFLQSIPTTLQYIENVSNKHQELKQLHELIKNLN